MLVTLCEAGKRVEVSTEKESLKLHRNVDNYLYFMQKCLSPTSNIWSLEANGFSTIYHSPPAVSQEKWERSDSAASGRTRLSSSALRRHIGKVSISLRPVAAGLCATVDTSHRDWVPHLAHSSKWYVCLSEGLNAAGNSHIVDGGQTLCRMDSHNVWFISWCCTWRVQYRLDRLLPGKWNAL